MTRKKSASSASTGFRIYSFSDSAEVCLKPPHPESQRFSQSFGAKKKCESHMSPAEAASCFSSLAVHRCPCGLFGAPFFFFFFFFAFLYFMVILMFKISPQA